MRAAAFFDVDGTLTRTTVVEPLIWYQKARLSAASFSLWAAGLIAQAPWYVILDRQSRSAFNTAFFQRYRGLKTADLADWHRKQFDKTLRPRLFPKGVECVRAAKAEGRAVVIVTGGLEWVMRPLAEYLGADHLYALQMKEEDGVCTGETAGPPIAEERKAELVREYAQSNDIDLSRSSAYGDSHGDVPMLECVGEPVAVNAGRRLRAVARARHWREVTWRLNG